MSKQYKQEYYQEVNRKFEEKTATLPEFLKSYFSLFKSALTKKNYFSYLTHMLNWMIENGVLAGKTIEELKKAESFLKLKLYKRIGRLKRAFPTMKSQSITEFLNQKLESIKKDKKER